MQTDRKQLRKFGLIMPIPLTLIAAFLLFKGYSTAGFILIGISALFLLFGLVAPMALGPVFKGWMAFAKVLGYINSMILLSVIFFLIIAPMAIVFRLLKKDPLHRGIEEDADSYWVDRDASSMDPLRYERQF